MSVVPQDQSSPAGEIGLVGVTTTPTSLTINEGLTIEAWRQNVETLKRIETSWPWWIGDLLVGGRAVYGDAIDALGVEIKTLDNKAWVARKVAPGRRRQELPWRAHRVVAKCEPHEQERWLARAAKEGWTSDELSRQLHGEAKKNDTEDETESDHPEDEYNDQQRANLGLGPPPEEDETEDFDAGAHWAGMPGYKPIPLPPRVIVSFETEADRDEFMQTMGSPVVHQKNGRTWSIWYPDRPKDDVKSLRFEDGDE